LRSGRAEGGRRPRVAAILLAAGRSRRFGRANKLLQPLAGRPLLEHALTALTASRIDEVVVVCGHQQAAVRQAVVLARRRLRRALRLRSVRNRAYASGLASSLRCGLRALPATTDAALICLADMPSVEPRTVNALRCAFRSGDLAVVPVGAEGRRGNPVLLGASLFSAVDALRGDRGARVLLSRLPVRELRVPAGSFADVDRRGDLRRAQRIRTTHPRGLLRRRPER
jgi:molybdenum cofactor cytidylyltransferase